MVVIIYNVTITLKSLPHNTHNVVPHKSLRWQSQNTVSDSSNSLGVNDKQSQ